MVRLPRIERNAHQVGDVRLRVECRTINGSDFALAGISSARSSVIRIVKRKQILHSLRLLIVCHLRDGVCGEPRGPPRREMRLTGCVLAARAPISAIPNERLDRSAEAQKSVVQNRALTCTRGPRLPILFVESLAGFVGRNSARVHSTTTRLPLVRRSACPNGGTRLLRRQCAAAAVAVADALSERRGCVHRFAGDSLARGPTGRPS